MHFGLVTVFPKCVIFATFSEDLLAVSHYFVLHFGGEA